MTKEREFEVKYITSSHQSVSPWLDCRLIRTSLSKWRSTTGWLATVAHFHSSATHKRTTQSVIRGHFQCPYFDIAFLICTVISYGWPGLAKGDVTHKRRGSRRLIRTQIGRQTKELKETNSKLRKSAILPSWPIASTSNDPLVNVPLVFRSIPTVTVDFALLSTSSPFTSEKKRAGKKKREGGESDGWTLFSGTDPSSK